MDSILTSNIYLYKVFHILTNSGGDSDIIEFDNWLFSVIRRMKIANICGPVYVTDDSSTLQVLDIDVQCTNTLATFLGHDA